MQSAPAHRQAVLMPDDWAANDLDVKVQIPGHALQYPPLLVVLLPKQRNIWLHDIEELCHHLPQTRR